MLGLKGVSRPTGGVLTGLFTTIGIQIVLAILSVATLLLIAGFATRDWLTSAATTAGITIGITTFVSIALQVNVRYREYRLEPVKFLRVCQFLQLEDDGFKALYTESIRIKARRHGVCGYDMRMRWDEGTAIKDWSPLDGREKYDLTVDATSNPEVFHFRFLPLRKRQYVDLGVRVTIDDPRRVGQNCITLSPLGMYGYLASLDMELGWDDSIDLDAKLVHVSHYRIPQDDSRDNPPIKVYRDLRYSSAKRRISWTVRNPQGGHKYKFIFLPPWSLTAANSGQASPAPVGVGSNSVQHADGRNRAASGRS